MESDLNDSFTLKNEVLEPEKPPLALETAFTTFWSITVALNALLVFIIIRFKRLRTASNLFVANWFIAELISFMLSPVLVTLLFHFHEFDEQTFCFLVETQGFSQSTAFLFQSFTVIDWFITNNIKAKYVVKWKKSYILVILASWASFIFSYLITSLFCSFEMITYHGPWMATGFFTLLAILVIISHIINFCRIKRNSIRKCCNGLILVTTAFIFRVANEVYVRMSTERFVFITSLFVRFCSFYTVFILLCFLEKDFRLCLKQFCKCNAKEVDDEDKQRNVIHEQCQKCGKDITVSE